MEIKIKHLEISKNIIKKIRIKKTYGEMVKYKKIF